MSKRWEIGFIILLITIIIVIYFLPIVSNIDLVNIENIIQEVLGKFEHLQLFEDVNTFNKKIIIKNRKADNILQDSQLDILNNLIKNSEFIEDENNNYGGLDCGENINIYKNKEIEEFLINVLFLDKYNKIWICKASKNHNMKINKFEIMNNFDGKLKKAKTIWYYFPEEWIMNDWWMLKDIENNRFYAPELNSLVQFNSDDNYEWLNLKGSDKYFIVIIKF